MIGAPEPQYKIDASSPLAAGPLVHSVIVADGRDEAASGSCSDYQSGYPRPFQCDPVCCVHPPTGEHGILLHIFSPDGMLLVPCTERYAPHVGSLYCSANGDYTKLRRLTLVLFP